MTHYVTKPHQFDELHVTSSTTVGDITAHFGSSYDANKFTLGFIGAGGDPGSFIILYTKDGKDSYLFTGQDTYLRAERNGDGATVGYTYSGISLADDPDFNAV